MVWTSFVQAFDALPLAAVINGKFLALHGGLSPELKVVCPPMLSALHFGTLWWRENMCEQQEERETGSGNLDACLFGVVCV